MFIITNNERYLPYPLITQNAPWGRLASLTTYIPLFLTIFIVNDVWLITNRLSIDLKHCSIIRSPCSSLRSALCRVSITEDVRN